MTRSHWKARTPNRQCFRKRSLLQVRRGSVELEAVLITAVMFPLAVALYYMAIRAFGAFYKLIAGVLEWPYL